MVHFQANGTIEIDGTSPEGWVTADVIGQCLVMMNADLREPVKAWLRALHAAIEAGTDPNLIEFTIDADDNLLMGEG